jgi:predicted 3-demethylubiquinone-9 3-methyltransferase (glyoxalase superfamily)
MQKISPFIWLYNNAEKAMNIYLSIFKNSNIIRVARNPTGAPGPIGALIRGSQCYKILKINVEK